MAKTEVILTHNVVGLGGESDQVKVAAGFARNYLLPRGLAIPVTAANKRRLDALKQRRAEREAHEHSTMSELAKSLSKMILTISVKTGDDGKMFGSITPGTIADELHKQVEIQLDKRKIHIEQPIRHTGEFEIEMRLHPEVQTKLKLRVQSTTPAPKPAEAAATAPKTEKHKGHDVGGRPDRKTRKVITDDRKKPNAAAAAE